MGRSAQHQSNGQLECSTTDVCQGLLLQTDEPGEIHARILGLETWQMELSDLGVSMLAGART